MSSIDISVDIDGLDEAFDELEQEVAGIIRGISIELWNHILVETPQYYGRLAASWTYSLGTPVYVDRSKTMEFDIPHVSIQYVGVDKFTGEEGFFGRRKGDPEAIGIANFASEGREVGFRLGQDIWLANGADHGEGAYSQEIEDAGSGRLRPVNQPGHAVARSIDALSIRYGDDITPLRAEQLQQLRIGGNDA